MGELVAGKWQRTPLIKRTPSGRFVRAGSTWTGEVRADGAPGPDGRRFVPQAGRYRLVVAWACPWAHRAVLARALAGLEQVVALDVVEPVMGEDGWSFAPAGQTPAAGSTDGGALGVTHLHELYTRANPSFDGRVTVPVLWDAVDGTIVSNDSASLLRMLADPFGGLAARKVPLEPKGVPSKEAQALVALVQTHVNQGVYRCGFAQTQAAYDEAVATLFDALDQLEARLAHSRFLWPHGPSEVDWRLMPTLLRFDWVYVTHFKCNVRRLTDYPNLYGYLRDLVQWPHVAETFDEAQTKLHYFASHGQLNPSGIVPRGLQVDLRRPPGRAHLA